MVSYRPIYLIFLGVGLELADHQARRWSLDPLNHRHIFSLMIMNSLNDKSFTVSEDWLTNNPANKSFERVAPLVTVSVSLFEPLAELTRGSPSKSVVVSITVSAFNSK